MKKLVLGVFFATAVAQIFAQTTLDELRAHPEFTASNYLAYPEPAKNTKYTKAPAGYTPFYISHYGRHGSRYHHSADEYKYIFETLSKADSANKLTEQGKAFLAYAKVLAETAAPRAGELTKTGASQHEGIARRMYKNYSEIFKERARTMPRVKAYASTSGRCIVSMAAFLAELRAQNSKIDPEMISGKSYMSFICAFDWNKLDYSREKTYTNESDKLWANVNSQPVMNKLINDSAYIAQNIDANNFYNKLYEITTSLTGMDKGLLDEIERESKTSIKDIENLFTTEEKISRWQAQNAWWYSLVGTSPLIAKPDGLNFAKPTLQNIIDEADSAIASHTAFAAGNKAAPIAATLRFGHDTGLLPLSALMQLSVANAKVEDLSKLYEQWTDFKVIPMAGNLQIVFYMNKAKKQKPGEAATPDILVKFLYNELEVTAPIPCKADEPAAISADNATADASDNAAQKQAAKPAAKSAKSKCPAAPYYRWEDVRDFYQKIVNE